MGQIRPPLSVLEQYGKVWANDHDYKRFVNGNYKTKHGIVFKNAVEIGHSLVDAGLIQRVGTEYQLKGA